MLRKHDARMRARAIGEQREGGKQLSKERNSAACQVFRSQFYFACAAGGCEDKIALRPCKTSQINSSRPVSFEKRAEVNPASFAGRKP
jgi:hypothetical protein